MPNTYVIKAKCGEHTQGYISIYADKETVQTKQAARYFSCLLDADCYAAALDMQYPGWSHIVEVL